MLKILSPKDVDGRSSNPRADWHKVVLQLDKVVDVGSNKI
jgi:hypothetical protein